MSVHIAVIGCGSIGARHVEALGRLQQPVTVYGVDKAAAARERAGHLFRQRAAQAGSLSRYEALESCATLPDALDLVIVATTAQQRLSALQECVPRRRIGAAILEKFLFVRDEEFDLADELLGPLEGRVWVNCARRMYPGYQAIASAIPLGAAVDLRVTAQASVGPIGAIAIHFADLLGFLGHDANMGLQVAIAALEPVPTKRGLIDFRGELSAKGSDGRLRLHYQALDEHDAPLTIQITTGGTTYRVHEWRQRLEEVRPGGIAREQTFEVPFQSTLSDIAASQVLGTGSCPLTPYRESVGIHRVLLRALLGAYRRRMNDLTLDAVPFT